MCDSRGVNRTGSCEVLYRRMEHAKAVSDRVASAGVAAGRGARETERYETEWAAICAGAALQHRNAHCAKIIRTDDAIIHTWPFVRSSDGTSFHAETRRWAFVQREGIDEARVL